MSPTTSSTSSTSCSRCPSAEIGPLEREPYVAGPGHYQVDGSDLSIAGDWTVEVVARVDRFDQLTAAVTVPVNP